MWVDLSRACRRLVVPALGAIAFAAALSPTATTRAGFTLVDLAMGILLVAAVSGRSVPGASSRAVRAVAVTSYSVYMTHTAVLEVVSWSAGRLPPAVVLGLAVVLVGVVGAVFYAAVERPTMRARERWAPRRVESLYPDRPVLEGSRS
jgi:peptidoglycan/LPS O-acetylase OafA/YrhL